MRTNHDCSCGDCTTDDLPVNPFEALRASHGMLLGEDDFRVLMGNPRGKQMLHSSWLHGSGVVWGMGVHRRGLLDLVVEPGLAIDGRGRELALDASATVDLKGWLAEHDDPEAKQDCGTRKVRACLVAEFDCDTAHPVPVLADPCDVTRGHDAPSRILETARLRLLPGRCRPCPTPYHRLRVLWGLEPVGEDDEAGREAARARAEVLALPAGERSREMLRQMRCLAAADAADLCPAPEEGVEARSPFPVPESQAAVVLGCVVVKVRDDDGCTTVEKVRIDDCCRCVLLPTQTIGDLLAGMATCLPGAPGGGHHAGAGPRVHGERVRWEDDFRRVVIPVTDDLAVGSLRRAITVTSLSARGWSDEDIEAVRYDAEQRQIEVELACPAEGVVRIVVKGTGPTPVFGLDPVAPLAGLVGGPPVAPPDGHDAVITFTEGLWNGDAS